MMSGRERLEKGLEFFIQYTATETEFEVDMESWFSSIFEVDGKPEIKCGSGACAFGTMALCPELQKEGLGWSTRPLFDGTARYLYAPVYKGSDAFEAAKRFFEIGQYDAEYLFDPSEYSRVEQEDMREAVIYRIQRFLAQPANRRDTDDNW